MAYSAVIFFIIVVWLRIIQSESYPPSISNRLKYSHAGMIIFAVVCGAPYMNSLAWMIKNPTKLLAIITLNPTSELGAAIWGVLELVLVVSALMLMAACYMLARRRRSGLMLFQCAWFITVVGSLVKAFHRVPANASTASLWAMTTVTLIIYAVIARFFLSKRVIAKIFTE